VAKRFLIADTHFGDKNICRIENRPFATELGMTSGLIKKWNEVVSDEDTVYLLGDIGVKEVVYKILSEKKLKGKIILIVGNHDKGMEEDLRRLGVEVIEHPIIVDDFWIFSHEPMYVSEQMPYANVFGHVHNNPMYKTVSSRSYCVSVERIGFMPIDFEVVKQAVRDACN
jgi:calcineurin-like phosphoesterase family protein